MKKILKISLLFLILAISVLLFVSCEKDNKSNNNSVVLETVSDIAEYKIVRPDSGDGAKAGMVALNKALYENLDITLEVGTDSSVAASKEILIGLTSRKASADVAVDMRPGDWTVKMVGSKIVIIGGNDTSLEKAVDFVIKNCINKERNIFAIPGGNGYSYIHTYADKFTIAGTDIKNFIVTSSTYDLKNLVKRFEDEVVGFKMESKKSELVKEGEHCIIVEATEVIENKYSVFVKDGSLVIKGSYNSVDDAVDYFCTDFVKNNGGSEIKLDEDFYYEGYTAEKKIYTKDQLWQVLNDVYNDPDKLIIGEQNEDWASMPSTVIKKFEKVSGELPGMIGLDLGLYGLDLKKRGAKPEQWSRSICEIVDFCANGGIVTISSHVDNPYDPEQRVKGYLGEFTTKEELEANFEALLTDGTELNKAFMEDIARDGLYLQHLRDNGVPVVWRPFHEMNGTWFWFCVTSNGITINSEKWADMWRYIYDYYTNELGLDNLIWVYAPNASGNLWDETGATMSTMYCYPGNDYVDMVGVDQYFNSGYNGVLGGYAEMIDSTGLIGALTEYGPRAELLIEGDSDKKQEDVFNCMDAHDLLEHFKNSGYKMAYALSWADGQGYSAWGKCDEFMKLDYTLGAKDLKVIFEKFK